MNPDDLLIPRWRVAIIHPQTEQRLLEIGVENWWPVMVTGKWVLDGVQRVLVARKHGYTDIKGEES